METVTLRAHFDGERILLDDPYDLKPNTNLLVTVLRATDDEEKAWLALPTQGLEAAYSDADPDYSLSLIKEANPGYKAG
jgi:hypothetical protein